MKYLGKKSLSSAFGGFLQVGWYLMFLASILTPVIMTDLLFFGPAEYPFISVIDKIRFYIFHELSSKEKDFQIMLALPYVVKIFIVYYAGMVMVVPLFIIKKGQHVFNNFKNNIVFSDGNALLISKISKLMIGYSILTFNFSSLLVSIILLILSAIFKNGSALQEEHDLTV